MNPCFSKRICIILQTLNNNFTNQSLSTTRLTTSDPLKNHILSTNMNLMNNLAFQDQSDESSGEVILINPVRWHNHYGFQTKNFSTTPMSSEPFTSQSVTTKQMKSSQMSMDLLVAHFPIVDKHKANYCGLNPATTCTHSTFQTKKTLQISK